MIHDVRALNADRTGKANRCSRDFQDRRFIGQLDGRRFGGSANLAFVRRMVTSQKYGDRLAIGLVDQRLDERFRVGLQQFADLFNAACVRCIDFHRRRRTVNFRGKRLTCVRFQRVPDSPRNCISGSGSTKSSPLSAGTMNSCEASPPIGPLSASTGRYFKPQRSKIRQ